jgi:ankyrin repeat domain-containing protein 50
MADYGKHLASLRGDAAASADLSTPRSVESIVNKLLEDREKKRWRVSLLGKDIKVRKQVEVLTKFLLWSDPIVKAAVSAQPYAALAWSGVSLLLPVGKLPSPAAKSLLTLTAPCERHYAK